MKTIIHKILSFFLALLVLLSTASFSIDRHYCGEHLVDVAIFGEAMPCAMELALDAKYGSEHTKKSDCCKDEKTVIKGQDELKLQFDHNTLDNVVFLQTFIYTYTNLFEGLERYVVPFDGYPPPLLITDFQPLFEQYII